MSSIVAATRDTIEWLIKEHGIDQKSRIDRGVRQVAARWKDSDGDNHTFREFCQTHFVSQDDKLTALRKRFQDHLESVYGNLHRAYRDLNWMLHVDAGDMQPVDTLFANVDLFAHIQEDFFQTKLAFVVLLNFPLVSMEDKNTNGNDWARAHWADIRLAEQFEERIPGEVRQKRTQVYTAAEDYVYSYNIHMNTIVDNSGKSPFPKDLKLISHWGLRDEIKAQYAGGKKGLAKQQLIHQIMQRIIKQEIPIGAINNPDVTWNPVSNVLKGKTDSKPESTPEATRRYECLWSTFEAEKLLDPYTPSTPSLVDRRFKSNREIPEEKVESLLRTILTAPVMQEIADLMRQRVGRPLEAFDNWYSGFSTGGSMPETELDRHVQTAYPNLAAFENSLADILRSLGFSQRKARYLKRYIRVDAARGAGHALGAQMRKDTAHLRTRVPEGGMDYKGFNTAMHELGHSVEQVFSLNDIDYYTLEGVPNTAFTEAFAFVFQDKDLDVLGLAEKNPKVEALNTLHTLWQTLEICGVSLLDMYIWRWMYANPQAGPKELKKAVLDLSAEVWNSSFASLFGVKDQHLLAIYSHILYCGMYIPDYAIGHIMAFQIEHYLKERKLAREMERMCKLGRIAPDVWMQQAIGEPISAESLLTNAAEALEIVTTS